MLISFILNIFLLSKNEVNTNIPKQQMRDLLLLCTENVHFGYNRDIYIQASGMAMG